MFVDHRLRLLHLLKEFLERRQVLVFFFGPEFHHLHLLEILHSEFGLVPGSAREYWIIGLFQFLADLLFFLLNVEVEQRADALVEDSLGRLRVEALVEARFRQQAVNVFGLVPELGRIPLAEVAVDEVEPLLQLKVDGHAQHLKADWALQVSHAEVVLVLRIYARYRVEAVPAVVILHFFFCHAVTTHALLTVLAEVHLVAYKYASAAALIVHVWRLFRGQTVHRVHLLQTIIK